MTIKTRLRRSLLARDGVCVCVWQGWMMCGAQALIWTKACRMPLVGRVLGSRKQAALDLCETTGGVPSPPGSEDNLSA